VIIGVTCAVVTAMVITGVLLAVKFSLDTTAEIVKVYGSDFSCSDLSECIFEVCT